MKRDIANGRTVEMRDGRAAEVIRLSRRQRQVMAGIAHGESSKEMAAHLKISVRTVEVYRSQLMRTFGVHRSKDAYTRAKAAGLTEKNRKNSGRKLRT